MSNLNRVISGFSGAAKDAGRRYEENARRQESALRLLRPDEVAGDYDAGRLLSTTLGGVLRPITHDDLQAFRRNAEALGKAFRGGITAKAIIDRSLAIDRERANQQIRVALPRQFSDGKMHFVTNASDHSNVTTHHVLVEFLNYGAAVSSPVKASELVKTVAGGPIRVACDCGRWHYWYSYVATIGKFNAGIPQLGYPRIRNPRLVGVACKHILRTMQQLSSPLVRAYVEKMVDAGRKQDASKVIAVSKKDAAELAREQQRQAGWKRNTVESAVERQRRISQQRAVQAVVQRSNMALKGMTPRKIDAAKRAFELNARKLAGMGVLTPAQLNAMLAKLKA